jgi:hypothetical protein
MAHLLPVIGCRGFVATCLRNTLYTRNNFIKKKFWSKAGGVYPHLPPISIPKEDKTWGVSQKYHSMFLLSCIV